MLEPSGQEVAVIPAGGFFGEMSMLTGDRRTATVKAMDDVAVLEISAGDFRELALANPACSITSRRSSSDAPHRPRGCDARGRRRDACRKRRQKFLARMRRFLTLNS